MAVNWARFPDGAGEPAPEWPLEPVLDAVAAAGFTAIGLDHYILRAHGGTPLEIARLLHARGLRCTDVGIAAVGALARADVESLAEAGRALGAAVCIAALYRPLSHDQIVRDLRAAADVLAPAGIRIAFEFTSYGSPTSLSAATAVCDAVGWERCGLLVDAWHLFRGGESLTDVAGLDGGRIALVHVSDGGLVPHADPVFEGRNGRLLPGSGSFDLDGLANALAAAGYAGPLALEVLSAELRRLPPDEGARRLRAAARTARLG
jgi:sugar phosphate isomerase/epimerase